MSDDGVISANHEKGGDGVNDPRLKPEASQATHDPTVYVSA